MAGEFPMGSLRWFLFLTIVAGAYAGDSQPAPATRRVEISPLVRTLSLVRLTHDLLRVLRRASVLKKRASIPNRTLLRVVAGIAANNRSIILGVQKKLQDFVLSVRSSADKVGYCPNPPVS